MKKYITEINTVIPGTKKEISINLQGQNLIITGGNGCGKTRLLTTLHQEINNRFEYSICHRHEQLDKEIQKFKVRIDELQHLVVSNEHDNRIENYQQQIRNHQQQIRSYQQNIDELFNSNIQIKFDNLSAVNNEAVSQNLLIRFFEATRQYSLQNNRNNQSQLTVDRMLEQGKNSNLMQDDSFTSEGYLVAYLTAGYLAFGLRQDIAAKNKVDTWLGEIISDLRFLFEDESLELVFREREKVFYIEQDGKIPYKISDLSSGYSSILKIYTDLLMKVELRGIAAKELSGIVIIDEIDAHLHVSLQKKILSFFDNAYPNVQFIVSTHSPFVIQSVDNAVIYDLSKLEQLGSLSMYSYEAIIKGLLGVKTTSNTLDELVSELSDLTSRIEDNRERVEMLIAELNSSKSKLDSRSKVTLLIAQQSILDLEGE